MKIFNAVLLAGLFAAVAAQCPESDLDIKILKVVDSAIEDKDSWKFTAILQGEGDFSVEDVLDQGDIEVKLATSTGGALDSQTFSGEDCTLRGSGKSAICKEELSRLTISKVRSSRRSKSGTRKSAGVPGLAFQAKLGVRVLAAKKKAPGAVGHVFADGAGVVARCKIVPGLACRARLVVRVLEATEPALDCAVGHVFAGGAGVVARCKIVPCEAFSARLDVRVLEAIEAVCIAVVHVVAGGAGVVACKIVSGLAFRAPLAPI